MSNRMRRISRIMIIAPAFGLMGFSLTRGLSLSFPVASPALFQTIAQDASWISLLIQIPLVGVFIWYSLKLNDRAALLQAQFITAMEKRDQIMVDFMAQAKQDNNLAIDRNNAAISRIAEEVKSSTVAITTHNSTTSDFLMEMSKLINRTLDLINRYVPCDEDPPKGSQNVPTRPTQYRTREGD